MRMQQGFTLIEMMVAMAIMALIGVMSWAGLDVLIRSKNQVQMHGAHTAQMQVALQQWVLDLDQAWRPSGTDPMGWDGKVLRLTRRAAQPELGVTVVAWAVREDGEQKQLMRWQSAPFTRMEQWRQAWEQAAHWGRSSGNDQTTVLLPANALDIFVWSGDSWVNGQSSVAQEEGESSAGLRRWMKKLGQQPTGIRMLLSTPSGNVLKDWAALSLSEAKL